MDTNELAWVNDTEPNDLVPELITTENMDVVIDTEARHIRAHVPVYTIREFYKYIQDYFDDNWYIDQDVPMKRNCEHEYEIINGWKIRFDGQVPLISGEVIKADCTCSTAKHEWVVEPIAGRGQVRRKPQTFDTFPEGVPALIEMGKAEDLAFMESGDVIPDFMNRDNDSTEDRYKNSGKYFGRNVQDPNDQTESWWNT